MIEHCRTCIMPSSRPRIVFKDGVCNACRFADEQKQVGWAAREAEFHEIVAKHRGEGHYDCVVPFSGGKDSAYVAWKLRDLGLRPLLVCYGQMLWTEEGRYNFNQVCNSGFDILYWRVDQNISKKLARRFLIERFHIKNHYDAGVNAVPLIIAKNFSIPLIFFSEFGEACYGGKVLNEESKRTRNLTEVLEHQIGDHPLNWATDGVSESELAPYIYPDDVSNTTAFYFSYFFCWDIFKNAEFCKDEFGFKRIEPRSDASFEGFDSIDDMVDGVDFFGMATKFGFGRSTRMASRLIQSGHLTREKGLEYVRKYDLEYPVQYLREVLDYVGMSKEEFDRLTDTHRNPEIWNRTEAGWELRYPPK